MIHTESVPLKYLLFEFGQDYPRRVEKLGKFEDDLMLKREYEDHITRPPDYMECPIQVTRSWGCKVVRDERSMLILDHTGLVQPHYYLMMFMNVSL